MLGGKVPSLCLDGFDFEATRLLGVTRHSLTGPGAGGYGCALAGSELDVATPTRQRAQRHRDQHPDLAVAEALAAQLPPELGPLPPTELIESAALHGAQRMGLV